MSNLIRAVIFDVGGVLLRTEDYGPRQLWEKQLGLSPGELEAIVLNSAEGKAAQLGEVTEEQHWRWVAAHFRLSDLEGARLRQAFWQGDRLDASLVRLVRQLSRCYRTAIISNYMDGLRRELSEVHQIADAFELLVISSEVGLAKPDPRIFRLALDKLCLHPAEALFIDDFEHNIEGARDVGLSAILFHPGLDLAAELERYGISL